jgi:beta-lactamase superfamily II metal-dependent hydrolase
MSLYGTHGCRPLQADESLMKWFAAIAFAVSLAAGLHAASDKTLDIYFIDVEGGQSTLVVTPAGQSLLIDAGYPGLMGRDPDRIMAAVHDARLKRIDYLLVTHMHEDHNGGVPELQRRIPIGTFIDYGAPLETAPEVVAAFAAYREAREHAEHLIPKPGDRLPIRGVDVDVVSADGATLSRPLEDGGQVNPSCQNVETGGELRGENPRSIGVRVRFGAFRFLDLGDLIRNRIGDLICPVNLIGPIDVYLVAHHANTDPNLQATLEAVRPRVAIANNGPWKGTTAVALAALHGSQGLEDVWQLHRTINDGAENFPDPFVANLQFNDGDGAAWLKLSASDSGSFSITNGRTGWTRTYPTPRVPWRPLVAALDLR